MDRPARRRPAQGAFEPNPNGDYSDDFNIAWKDASTERDSVYLNARLTQALTDTIDARLSYAYTRNSAEWKEYGPLGLAADFRTLNRLVFASDDAKQTDHEVILDLSGETTLAGQTHRFIAGVNFRESDSTRPTQFYLVTPIDLYDPVYGPMDLSTKARDRGFIQTDRILAGFVQDRITIAEKWTLLAGLRYTDAEQSQKTTDFMAGDAITRAELGETAWTTQSAWSTTSPTTPRSTPAATKRSYPNKAPPPAASPWTRKKACNTKQACASPPAASTSTPPASSSTRTTCRSATRSTPASWWPRAAPAPKAPSSPWTATPPPTST